MAENKTKPTEQNVEEFLNGIEDERKRKDSFALIELMKQVTGFEPVMWGNIVGFGSYHYKYDSGREGDMMLAGFSPRKANLAIYHMSGFEGYDELCSKLGKHKTTGNCLYIKRLDDVDLTTLQKMMEESFKYTKQVHNVE